MMPVTNLPPLVYGELVPESDFLPGHSLIYSQPRREPSPPPSAPPQSVGKFHFPVELSRFNVHAIPSVGELAHFVQCNHREGHADPAFYHHFYRALLDYKPLVDYGTAKHSVSFVREVLGELAGRGIGGLDCEQAAFPVLSQLCGLASFDTLADLLVEAGLLNSDLLRFWALEANQPFLLRQQCAELGRLGGLLAVAAAEREGLHARLQQAESAAEEARHQAEDAASAAEELSWRTAALEAKAKDAALESVLERLKALEAKAEKEEEAKKDQAEKEEAENEAMEARMPKLEKELEESKLDVQGVKASVAAQGRDSEWAAAKKDAADLLLRMRTERLRLD